VRESWGWCRMIFQGNDEEEALRYICELAHEATDRICTDMNPKEYEKFKHLKVETSFEDGHTEMVGATQSYDVINWFMDRLPRDYTCDKCAEEFHGVPDNLNGRGTYCEECINDMLKEDME